MRVVLGAVVLKGVTEQVAVNTSSDAAAKKRQFFILKKLFIYLFVKVLRCMSNKIFRREQISFLYLVLMIFLCMISISTSRNSSWINCRGMEEMQK